MVLFMDFDYENDKYDVLGKITTLRQERNWSEYELSNRSGITQSTISSWYRKKTLPTIGSLVKICDAFNITLSQFFMTDKDNIVEVTERDREIIESLPNVNDDARDLVLRFLHLCILNSQKERD